MSLKNVKNANDNGEPHVASCMRCTWWDTKDKAPKDECPHCGSDLLVFLDMDEFMLQFDVGDMSGERWMRTLRFTRGRSFPDMAAADAARRGET